MVRNKSGSDEKKIVHESESLYIPIGTVHRLANPGKISLDLIEVQTGSYLGNDDIIRFEDVYRPLLTGSIRPTRRLPEFALLAIG